MAREVVRALCAGKAMEEACAEMERRFPFVTPADCARALRIAAKHIEILEDE
jgi:hypothetical protein